MINCYVSQAVVPNLGIMTPSKDFPKKSEEWKMIEKILKMKNMYLYTRNDVYLSDLPLICVTNQNTKLAFILLVL